MMLIHKILAFERIQVAYEAIKGRCRGHDGKRLVRKKDDYHLRSSHPAICHVWDAFDGHSARMLAVQALWREAAIEQGWKP